MKSLKITLTSLIFTLTACMSSTVSYQPSEVIDRMPGQSEAPKWANGQFLMFREKGDVVYISQLSMSADSRPDICLRSAADIARVNILRQIKEQITSSSQFSEYSSSSDPAIESLSVFLSQGKLSGVRTKEAYWEKRLESVEGGERVLRLYCSAQVAIEKSLLSRQLQNALQSQNKTIKEKLLKAQADFIEGLESK